MYGTVFAAKKFVDKGCAGFAVYNVYCPRLYFSLIAKRSMSPAAVRGN